MKLLLDEIEVEVDDSIGAHITSLQEAIEKERVRADSAEKSLIELPGKIKSRLSLETEARKHLHGNTDLSVLSDREVREAVVAKLQSSVDLKDKSDDYVIASFDVAVANAGKLSPIHSARQVTKQVEQKPVSLHEYYVNLSKQNLRS